MQFFKEVEKVLYRSSRRDLIKRLIEVLQTYFMLIPYSVSTLPSYIAPGSFVIFDNELWTGLAANSSSLPTGTPWPAKGFKSFIGRITDVAGGVDQHELIIYKSNIGTPVFTKISVNQYRLQFTSLENSFHYYEPFQDYVGDAILTKLAAVHFNHLNARCNVSMLEAFLSEDADFTLIVNGMIFPPPPA